MPNLEREWRRSATPALVRNSKNSIAIDLGGDTPLANALAPAEG